MVKNNGLQMLDLQMYSLFMQKLMAINSRHFIVEKEFPGVSVGAEEKKMGIKSSSTRTLILQDAQVPVENLLGEIGRGHIIAFNILNIGRYKLGVGTIGGSKRALRISNYIYKPTSTIQNTNFFI